MILQNKNKYGTLLNFEGKVYNLFVISTLWKYIHNKNKCGLLLTFRGKYNIFVIFTWKYIHN